MHIEVPALRYRDIMQAETTESSATVRARVKAARARQHRRFGRPLSNSQMSAREVKEHCRLSADCHEVLRQAMDVLGMSARGCDRLLRVALTIADLAGQPHITKEHLMEAIAFR